jgi:hypothetical protein
MLGASFLPDENPAASGAMGGVTMEPKTGGGVGAIDPHSADPKNLLAGGPFDRHNN